MVVPILGRIGTKVGTRAASFFGQSTGRAAAAGAGGGILLDDVPLVGPALDPTEGGEGPAISPFMIVALLVLVIFLYQMMGD